MSGQHPTAPQAASPWTRVWKLVAQGTSEVDPGEAWVSTLAEADGKKAFCPNFHTHGLKTRMKAEYAEAERGWWEFLLYLTSPSKAIRQHLYHTGLVPWTGCVQPPPNRPVSGTGFTALEGAGGKSEQRKRQYHFYMSIY